MVLVKITLSVILDSRLHGGLNFGAQTVEIKFSFDLGTILGPRVFSSTLLPLRFMFKEKTCKCGVQGTFGACYWPNFIVEGLWPFALNTRLNCRFSPRGFVDLSDGLQLVPFPLSNQRSFNYLVTCQ